MDKLEGSAKLSATDAALESSALGGTGKLEDSDYMFAENSPMIYFLSSYTSVLEH